MQRPEPVLRRLLGGSPAWLLATTLLLAAAWLAGIGLLALSGWFITASALAGAGLLLGLDIFLPSAGIRAAALLRTVARYGERVVGHETVLRRLAELRRDTFAAIARLPLAARRALRSGDWQGRLGADIDALDAVPLRVLAPAAAAALSVLAAAGLATALGAVAIAGLVLGLGLLIGLGTVVAVRAGLAHGEALVAGRHAERVALLDHLGGQAELRAFGALARSREALAACERDQSGQLARQQGRAALLTQLAQLAVWLASLGTLWLSLSGYLAAAWSGPVAVLLPLMVLGLGEALSALPGAGWRLGESIAAARRLDAVEAGGPAVLPGPRAVAAPSDAAGLVVRGLRIGFDARRPLLPPLDLAVQPGRPLVLVAASGTGKSVLLETLAGERPALGGGAWLHGGPVAALDADAVALLPQETVLLDASIAANLRLARPDVSPEAAGALLRGLGLDAFAPDGRRGWRLRVGEAAGNLSGGEARRLLLAWLLLRQPRLALLDEPFAGLDADTTATVLATMSPWLAGRCCVIATHEPGRLPPDWPRLRLD